MCDAFYQGPRLALEGEWAGQWWRLGGRLAPPPVRDPLSAWRVCSGMQWRVARGSTRCQERIALMHRS
jgi:hypothetical protein